MKKIVIALILSLSICLTTACGKTTDVQYNSSEYIPESDDQPNIAFLRSFAEESSGYYFLDPFSFVQYYDVKTGKNHILCNKPECAHEDVNCNAYAGGVTMRYAEGNLYYVAEDNSTGDFYFWRKSGDGVETEKLFFCFV